MSELAPLISDLALILICAGIMTLVFKRLKQPLVLGYIVAGFLASPHVPFTPSVIDMANIHTWSDIGVIFLLFALGLEFSFKKLVKVGGTAVIAACTIIFCMILVGMFVGWSFGWKHMDCLYLGGMLAMSSTTIIYKAFDDLGLRQQRFAGLVLSILILEDILAIVLMVMLSTMAVSQNFEGTEMMYSIGKLLFFLILWFVVGIYVIPTFLKRSRKWMGNETLLIVSLAMCFGMVVLAAQVGFSAAFGAFIMGSILAETVEAENIEKLVAPVKDLFGAIFFVSVGMMVDPAMIVEYAWPIVAITCAILLGQVVFGTGGVILAGQPLKVAMQCGFSLTQIGEFAFIIASQMAVMRTQLISGLVDRLKYNLNRKADRAALFELGRIFRRDPSVKGSDAAVEGVYQPLHLAALVYGSARPAQWGEKARNFDFFDLKGAVEMLLPGRNLRFEKSNHPALHPGRAATVYLDGEEIGFIGELHPELAHKYELPHSPVVFELKEEALLDVGVPVNRSLSKFQPMSRDVAVFIDDAVPVQKLMDAVRKAAKKDPRLLSLSSFKLFDLYKPQDGANVGKKSLAFNMLLQRPDAQLSEEEADEAVAAVVEALAKEGAVLRD